MRKIGCPLCHKRCLPFAAEGDEAEKVRALRFTALCLFPGIGEELCLGLTAEEFRGRVFDDAGDVGSKDFWRNSGPAQRRCAGVFR
jgi:hypothetical protein